MLKNQATQYRPVTHCIFNMNGVVLNIEDNYTDILDRIASKYGKQLTTSLRIKLFGMREQEIAGIMIQELGLPITVMEFIALFRHLDVKLLPDIGLISGVERLLQHLQDNQIPTALVTRSSKTFVDNKQQKHQDTFAMFNHFVSETDYPEKNIYLVAASQFRDNPAPDKCLVFEFSPRGVSTATMAGMQTVMIPDRIVPKNMCRMATEVLDYVEDFKPEIFGLPPFPSIDETIEEEEQGEEDDIISEPQSVNYLLLPTSLKRF